VPFIIEHYTISNSKHLILDKMHFESLLSICIFKNTSSRKISHVICGNFCMGNFIYLKRNVFIHLKRNVYACIGKCVHIELNKYCVLSNILAVEILVTHLECARNNTYQYFTILYGLVILNPVYSLIYCY